MWCVEHEYKHINSDIYCYWVSCKRRASVIVWLCFTKRYVVFVSALLLKLVSIFLHALWQNALQMSFDCNLQAMNPRSQEPCVHVFPHQKESDLMTSSSRPGPLLQTQSVWLQHTETQQNRESWICRPALIITSGWESNTIQMAKDSYLTCAHTDTVPDSALVQR